MNEDKLYTQSQLERYEDLARKNALIVGRREGYENGYRAGVVMGVFASIVGTIFGLMLVI